MNINLSIYTFLYKHDTLNHHKLGNLQFTNI